MRIEFKYFADEIEVPRLSGRIAYLSYQDSRGRIERLGGVEPGSVWMDLDNSVSRLIVRRFIDAPTHEGFTACFVSYPLPTRKGLGITRREATRILRLMGLQPPSTEQVIQLAVKTISTGEVLRVIMQNDNRRVVAPVPIHPEAPEFLRFGLGFKRKDAFTGSFSLSPYRFAGDYHSSGGKKEVPMGEGKDHLYFYDDTCQFGYTFPLILGIRPK